MVKVIPNVIADAYLRDGLRGEEYAKVVREEAERSRKAILENCKRRVREMDKWRST